MSLAKRIREWLAAQDGPRTSAEIAEGIGYATSAEKVRIQQAVACQTRKGLMVQHPAATRFTLGRPAQRIRGSR